ncbi:MAG: type II secretion system protein [bacterium]|nr:type II secretion system protein [bacterium]MDD4153137.1 type II secretion system protein [bacterium]
MECDNKKGFTLIELIVVITIIALLSSILFPVFAKARSKAAQATCANNLKQLGAAFHMYAQDWDGAGVLNYRAEDKKSWPFLLAPYIDVKQQQNPALPINEVSRVYFCPALYAKGFLYAVSHASKSNYSYNQRLANYNIDTVRNSSQTILLVDSKITAAGNAERGFGSSWSTANYYNIMSLPHNDGGNVVCLDNHLEFIKVSAIEPAFFESLSIHAGVPQGVIPTDRREPKGS